jgi:ABC-type glutathione transport system ATPase component
MELRKYKSIDTYSNKPVLAEIAGLRLSYKTKKGDKLIINNASLKIRKGEIFGLIGESGSGKSVITSTLTGLNVDIQSIESGTITIKGKDVTGFTSED